jgi:hypothetical protein
MTTWLKEEEHFLKLASWKKSRNGLKQVELYMEFAAPWD